MSNAPTASRGLCIVGVSQRTTFPPGPAPEPLVSWERLGRAAAEDAGVPDALTTIDSLQVVYCQSWQYDDPIGRLAERLGASPRHRFYSGIGGTTPQVMLSDAAAAMQRGDYDIALVVSAEALATKRAAKRAGETLPWSHRETVRSPYPISPPPPVELAHLVFQAWETFPLWDTARRARRGESIVDYNRRNAEMMAAMTPVAAANPFAWKRETLSADEIEDAGPRNRYVGWPYPKNMVSMMDVDMAAALLLTTVEKADALGIPAHRRVHLASSTFAEDPAGITERDDMSRSAAMAAAGHATLSAADLSIAEIDHLDLYSCFPSSLNLACDALGLDPLDARGLTVTGGLPYAGGAASAYLMNAIATSVERLRERPGSAYVTGVGMHLQKHTAAVYRSKPGWNPTDDVQAQVDQAQPRRPVLSSYEGPATVAAYTVAHDRDNQPQVGLVVLDVPGGRTLARVHEPALLADAEAHELVGQQVAVTTDGKTNEARW